MQSKLILIAAPVMALAALAAPVLAQETEVLRGPISTMERGTYACELPGTANSERGIAQPKESFRIASASRYVATEGRGTYLRRGDVLLMTSGPRNGTSYAIVSEKFLRKIENGKAGRLRCIRGGR